VQTQTEPGVGDPQHPDTRFAPEKDEMKQSNFESKAIALLGTFLQSMIDCAVAPTNASCLLVAAKEWVSEVWLQFVGAWREL
jgi:hypothetical protein